MLSDVLFAPRTFYERLNGNEPSLKIPVLIITLMALFTAMTGYLMGEVTGKLLSGFMEGLSTITAVSAAVTSFLAPYLMWVISAIILLIMTKIFKGTASFKRFAEIAGYGMIPLMLGSIISLGLSLYYIPQIVVKPLRVSDPEQIQELIMEFMNSPVMKEYTLVSTLLQVILLIWVANICAIGLEKCTGLSSRNAVIAAGLPVLIYALYTLGSLGMVSGWAI